MTPREIVKARNARENRYDVMPPEAPTLADRLGEHERAVKEWTREIRDTISAMRTRPSSPLTQARRHDVIMMWEARRQRQANAGLCRLLIAQREAQRSLMRAAK